MEIFDKNYNKITKICAKKYRKYFRFKLFEPNKINKRLFK